MPVLKPVFGIFAVLGWVFLIGLHVLWHYTFGWVFTTLADLLDAVHINAKFINIKPLGTPAAWLRSLDRNVDASLVKAANKLEHVAVWLFSRVAHFLGSVADELGNLAVVVEHKFLRLLKVTVPHLVRNLLRFVWRELRALGKYARKMIPKLARQILHFTRWAAHEIAKGAKHLGFLWKWIKAVIREHLRFFHAIWRRLTRLEHALVPKKFRGLVAGALKLLGLEWLFGTNISTLAVWIIGFNPAHLREYITDALEIFGDTDMCKVASFQFDLAVFVFDPVMQQLLGASDWVCRHSGHTLPSAVTDSPGYKLAWAPSATPPITGPFVPARLAPDVPLPRGVISA